MGGECVEGMGFGVLLQAGKGERGWLLVRIRFTDMDVIWKWNGAQLGTWNLQGSLAGG